MKNNLAVCIFTETRWNDLYQKKENSHLVGLVNIDNDDPQNVYDEIQGQYKDGEMFPRFAMYDMALDYANLLHQETEAEYGVVRLGWNKDHLRYAGNEINNLDLNP